MKKIATAFVISGVILAGLFSSTAFAGEKAEMPVTIKETTPYCCAVMEFSGSFEKIPNCINQFMGEFFKQGLTPGGVLHGVYYNSPEEVKPEELKWAIGFPVPKDAAIKKPLKKLEIRHKQAAVYMHVGPYEKTGDSYEKVMSYALDKGYKILWPLYEKYLDDPQAVKPENLRTEIIVPVEK